MKKTQEQKGMTKPKKEKTKEKETVKEETEEKKEVSTDTQFHIHKRIIRQLSIYSSPDTLHSGTIFVGKPLCGKRTLIRAFIHHLIQKPIITTVHHDTHDSMNIEFAHSPYHIEFHLEEYGLTDRYIVGEYIKKILDCQTIDGRIRIYVFYGLDTYTFDTQDMFVHLIEKYVTSARFIFTASSLQKIHPRVKAVSTTVRVPMPDLQEVRSYLAHKGMSITDADIHLQKIINDGDLGRLRYVVNDSKNTNETKSFNTLWSKIQPLIDRRDITSIVEMRQYLYNAITLTLPMNEFIQYICKYVMQQCPMSHTHLIADITQQFVNIEAKMHHVKHDIVCLEYAMLLAKRYIHFQFKSKDALNERQIM
jgi:DNA polymerase III delta prime subunit